MPRKIKLRLDGRPLRRSPGTISNVVRTAILAPPLTNYPVAQIIGREQRIVAGAPRTHHSKRKQRRRHYCKPPPRGRSYGPIRHAVVPKQYIPFTGPSPAPKPNTRDVATEILLHNKLHPKAGTFTRGDKTKQKSIDAWSRLKKATHPGFHWTEHMLVVMLRFLFGLIVNFNWGWTQAVHATSKLCCVDYHNVFKFANQYIESDALLPAELPQRVRGRGSLKFIAKYGKDKYSKLKEVSETYLTHLYVVTSNFCTHYTGASQDNR